MVPQRCFHIILRILTVPVWYNRHQNSNHHSFAVCFIKEVTHMVITLVNITVIWCIFCISSSLHMTDDVSEWKGICTVTREQELVNHEESKWRRLTAGSSSHRQLRPAANEQTDAGCFTVQEPPWCDTFGVHVLVKENRTVSVSPFTAGCSTYRRLQVWFPWSTCQSVLGQETEPQSAPDVLVGTLHGRHRRQWTYVWITVSYFGRKRRLNALKCKYK